MKVPETFAVTLEQCDMSKTAVRIPGLARRMMPEFWGWPDKYVSSKEAKSSQINQRSREIILEFRRNQYSSRLWGYATNAEFRFGSEEIRSSIRQVGDLLLLIPKPESGADFIAEVLYKDSPGYENLLKGCTYEVSVENSLKRFNYFDTDFEPYPPRRRLWTVILYRGEETVYMPFTEEHRADDLAKAIRKSNGEVEVMPLLEQVDFTSEPQQRIPSRANRPYTPA